VRTFLTSLALLSFTAGCGSTDKGSTPGVDASGEGSDASTPGPVTYEQVKAAVFAKKCVPCHVSGGAGAGSHTLAESYTSANEPSASCDAPKKKGECTIVLVKSGFMPFGKGCTGDPAKDAANAACLTAAEQKLLEDWIAGGLREK